MFAAGYVLKSKCVCSLGFWINRLFWPTLQWLFGRGSPFDMFGTPWYSTPLKAGISPSSLNFHCFMFAEILLKLKEIISIGLLFFSTFYGTGSHDHSFHDLPPPGPVPWSTSRSEGVNEILCNHHKQFQRNFNGMGKCSLYKVKFKKAG